MAVRPDIAGLFAFAFGDTPEVAEESLAQIIAGRKTAAFAPLRDLGPTGHEPLPAAGERYVILDSAGEPGALIEETAIFQCKAHELTDDFLHDCGADDVAAWMARHIAFIDRWGGWSDDLELVCDRFKLVEVLQ